MPAVYEYYSKHSRKVSASQMSLPDQLQNAANEDTSHSITLLPATTYSGPKNEPTRAIQHTKSPDQFYRQYNDQFAHPAGAPLRQGALRTTDPDPRRSHANDRSVVTLEDRRAAFQNGNSNSSQEGLRTHMSSPGLRGRKASVKNLIDQINATSTEPPLPSLGNSAPRHESSGINSDVSLDARFVQPNTSRQLFSISADPVYRYISDNNTTSETNVPMRFAMSAGAGTMEMVSQNRRPLFGEVVSSSAQQPTAGYGIQKLRKRSGSEGSPMPSPSLLQSSDVPSVSRNNYDSVTSTDQSLILNSSIYVPPASQHVHRRANSESPMTPTRGIHDAPLSNTSWPSGQNISYGSPSRIPVSIRRGSTSSEFDARSSTALSTPKAMPHLPLAEQKHLSSNRRQRSPPQIQSPGQRGKAPVIPQAPKSPSLRANIIVPPPKISPPLRSSRPRLPVSSASTAASRAKMAEKFSSLQKMNDEKRQAARKIAKPPELTDIDLKARRLRITQALSRSLEGQDLKGNHVPPKRQYRDYSTSRTASPATSDHSRDTEMNEIMNDIPAVIIDNPLGDDSREQTPVDAITKQERSFSQNALDAMYGPAQMLLAGEDDSPTLGPPSLRYLDRPTPLQTSISRATRGNEPSSAMTDGTTIDPEPQDDLQQRSLGRSLVDQISRMRRPSSPRNSGYDTLSDGGDQESVQIFMRDTLYMDDEEALQKGYRTVPHLSGPNPQGQHSSQMQRSSWASSVEDSDQEEDSEFPALLNNVALISPQSGSFAVKGYEHDSHRNTIPSVRSTMASDAYTIVNFVLQRHSTSGIVPQEFVDDVYQRVLEESPSDNERTMNPDRIEQICLQEIQDREESWYKPSKNEHSQVLDETRLEGDAETPTHGTNQSPEKRQAQSDWLLPDSEDLGLVPPPLPRGHRYKSSLDSAEDWADTSPSIGDWMRFAVDDKSPKSPEKAAEDIMAALARQTKRATYQRLHELHDQGEDPDLYSAPASAPAPAPHPPKHSPPPLPTEAKMSVEETSYGTALIQRPQIPRRVTSISQMHRTPPHRQSPSVSAPNLTKVSTEEVISPEQRRMKQRRNVIKELVDTEFSYEKDLRVLCDIYKQTASVALGEDDIRVLFGNVDQIQIFSKDFLMLLKSLAKPTYAMERQDRRIEKSVEKSDISIRPRSSSSTLASNKASENELPTPEKDRETRIGQAFEASLPDMEKVYTEYIKNRHAANLRLEAVQKSRGAREWLKECKDNSSDITNAWNLDALLVKPVQRITKYPLLLKELVDSTSDDHPDLPFLRKAMIEITEVNVRINEVKKQTELVDQVMNRKRKDSDVRAGLSKAFGRRAEKLKQHVGMTELFEDTKYNELKIHYDNNIVQLMVVGNDCSSYGRSITKWVNKMVEIAAAAEAWVDVGHSNHQEAESKLRQFAMVVRGISTIALPDHLEQLNNKVLNPMQQAVDAMTKFKTDPKGLLQKREKRMIDYAQIKSKKDRGEKIDKKMVERMEQSEALNVEAKERMRKLVASTAKLVQACQVSLIQMQLAWQSMVRQKLSAAMGISLEHLEAEDIEKEWQLDFDYQEASALTLGICNGSLLAEAVNMVNFQTSSTTLNGEESPRQASFTSASKRSISVASENSHPPIPDYDPRTSGVYGHHYHEHSIPYANPRGRAQSTTSAKYTRTPELSQQGSATEGFPNYGRLDSSAAAPRLSIEAHSPLLAILQPEPPPRRPTSSSTFFSASGTPPPQHQSTSSSIFSSAMPMSDSPVVERYSEEPGSLAVPDVLFTAASVYEFNIDRSRKEAGFPYLTYVTGEIFDVIGERGELWLARNQDDPNKEIGWIWNKHFAKLAE